jgi:hypothetical protein
VPILSARYSSAGRNTRSSAGFLPIADCAPIDFCPSVNLDLPWIAIPRQRCEFLSRCGTEQTLERPSRCLCQLPDSEHADLGQTRLSDRAYSPHQLDGQVVKEFQFGVGIDNH